MVFDLRGVLFYSLIFGVICLLLLDGYRKGFDRDLYQRILHCNLSKGTCLEDWDGATTRVTLVPSRPTRESPARLAIDIVGPNRPAAATVSAQLTMPRMDMGDHRFEFRELDSGTLVSEIELPYCVFDKTFWQLTIRSPEFSDLELVFDSVPFAQTSGP